eukprot:SAG22_NODE_7071_length_780_cov_0.787078_1_plen_241_part_10
MRRTALRRLLLPLLLAAAGAARSGTAAHESLDDSDPLLNRTLLLMSHSSGTGYLGGPGRAWDTATRFAKTQDGGSGTDYGSVATLADQLDCGARALDIRPLVKDNQTYLHHDGAITGDITLRAAVGSVQAWAAARQPPELVLLALGHCVAASGAADASCAAATALLSELGVPVLEGQRNSARGTAIRYSAALAIGPVVAVRPASVQDPRDETAGPPIQCYPPDDGRAHHYSQCCWPGGFVM